jgi:hypothetical protein
MIITTDDLVIKEYERSIVINQGKLIGFVKTAKATNGSNHCSSATENWVAAPLPMLFSAHHQDMNMVIDKDQLEKVQDRENLPIGYKNLQPSSIQGIQEDER